MHLIRIEREVEARPRNLVIRSLTNFVGRALLALGAERLGVVVVSLGYRFTIDGRPVGIREWIDAKDAR